MEGLPKQSHNIEDNERPNVHEPDIPLEVIERLQSGNLIIGVRGILEQQLATEKDPATLERIQEELARINKMQSN